MRFILSQREALNTALLFIPIPDSLELNEFSKFDPAGYVLLLGSDFGTEEPWNCLANEIRIVSSKYLKAHSGEKKCRATSVRLEQENGLIIGPGTGVAGFAINGVNHVARIEDGRVYIRNLESEEEITGTRSLDVERGKLLIEYSATTQFAEFFQAIESALASYVGEKVWVRIEH